MLTLHIGLPKTASTFLQYRVLNRQDRYTYIHSSASSDLEALVRRYVRTSESSVPQLEDDLVAAVPDGDVLLSDENIPMSPQEPWLGTGPTPRRTARRLARLGRRVGGVRVVLAIRRQPQWLASRYAESAKRFADFGQADFERRVELLCQQRPSGALRWLEYDVAYRELVSHLGRDNVLMHPVELLRDDPALALSRLEGFLGCDGWVEAYHAGAIDMGRSNALRTGRRQWTMRDHDSVLELPAALEGRARAVYDAGNWSLASVTGLELGRLGYLDPRPGIHQWARRVNRRARLRHG